MVTSSSIYVCALFVCMPCVVTSLGMAQDKLETSAEEETRVIGAGTFCAARVSSAFHTSNAATLTALAHLPIVCALWRQRSERGARARRSLRTTRNTAPSRGCSRVRVWVIATLAQLTQQGRE
jgi:ABC-type Fe3+ transport system permease subunit